MNKNIYWGILYAIILSYLTTYEYLLKLILALWEVFRLPFLKRNKQFGIFQLVVQGLMSGKYEVRDWPCVSDLWPMFLSTCHYIENQMGKKKKKKLFCNSQTSLWSSFESWFYIKKSIKINVSVSTK